ncbi:MAG: EAL domain-containing protein [Thermoanaerobaculia bacterium]|nr:EAL domain-containing protein [Thermoanaerobaculia bacterium]
MRVLLLVDDPGLRKSIQQVFAGRENALQVCGAAAEVEEALAENRLRVLLLDLEDNGARDLCGRLRQPTDGYGTYILGVVKEDTTQEVRAAFSAGADDHLLRPVQPKTLQIKLATAERTLAARAKQAELSRRLDLLQRRHRTLMETLREGVFVSNETGAIVFANSRLAALTGRSQEELKGLNADALVESKYRDRLPGRTLFGGGTEEYNIAVSNRESGRRWVELIVTPAASDDGRPGWTLGVMQDVTERREVEESMRHREEYYRALLENSSDVITILDIGGRTLFQSETSRRVLGLPPEEVVGDDLPNFLHPEDRERFEEALDDVLEQPGATRAAEIRYRRADGDYLVLESVLRNQVDNPVLGGVLVTSRDVTERRRVEQALKRERAFFQQLFRNSPAGIVILDHEDRVVDANHPFIELFQFHPDEMAGRPLSDFIVPEELRSEATTLSQSVFERRSVEKETVRQRKDGSKVEVSILGYPIDIGDRRIGAYGIYTDISERKAAERKLFHHAFHDELTGLPNRALFAERLERDLRRATRGDYLFAVLFIDLDRFKVINDSLGHAAGDELLVEMANRLEGCLRPGDTVARLGGDEFTILLEDVDEPTTATRIAERVLEALGRPFEIAGQEVVSSGSIGVAFSSPAYRSADDVLRDADIAMYRAKTGGKARYEIFDAEMHRTAVARLHQESLLRRAVENDEFELAFHPIVDLVDFHMTAVEALVRWRHPEDGLLPAGRWLATCQESGLMPAVGRWVVRKAVGQLADWRQRHKALDLCLHLNVSAQELGQPEYADYLLTSCKEANVSPDRVGLEISESLLVEDRDRSERGLLHLHRAGARLFIDDFGTGMSSLLSLQSSPVDAVKIDRSFVAGLDPGAKTADGSLEIVRAVAALAESLGKRVVAEGVETRQQMEQVRSLNVHWAQGHYFAQPLSARDLEAILENDLRWS